MPIVAYTGTQWLFLLSLIIVGLVLKILVLLWLQRDIVRRGRDPLAWIIVGIFADLLVLAVWLIVRPPLDKGRERIVPRRPEGVERAATTFGEPAPPRPAPPVGQLPTCQHCDGILTAEPYVPKGRPVACPACGLFSTFV